MTRQEKGYLLTT